ncbi:acyl-CoA dehydrogenase family protein [Salsipaludibacter albus]|uniref:acyl-CoA dehydrogenase family protein n=1 Tax=Salsipaludibacter albus TaxID=2849650 RepID=UPI001EE4B425|nr:acyl-CoA dehydrogenase family protein [Salsipaludibacter albus]MBY5161151.1 acyl-CoA dehydrogenase family protein [Salsipaludibacter albus]
MDVPRLLPDDEAQALLDLVTTIGERELRPRAATDEAAGSFPRDVVAMLGASGLLGLPYPVEVGGGGQPYEVYLQALEELARAWATPALATSVHVLSCHALAGYGTPEQQERLLGPLLAGDRLGAYALSEPQAGSDVAAMTTRARRDGDEWILDGTKAWITHGGHADSYTTFARTSEDRTRGISCFVVPGNSPGLSFGAPESKMGLTASPTTTVNYDGVRIPADNLVGEVGQGMAIALDALDSGRLGIAAIATGVSQAALDAAVDYAHEREQFGKPIIRHQGLAFLLADMATRVGQSRATVLDAARRRDAGQDVSRAASIAKLTATDNAMAVTTDAVQVFGGYGYTREFPVERYMREVKVMQIFEGTNQIQRLVISRTL